MKINKSNPFYRFIRFALLVFAKIYFRVSYRNRDFIPGEGGVLIAASHRSFLDPPLVGITCERTLHFMARSDLFTVPFIGKILPKINTFPVKRGQFDKACFMYTLKLLAAGECVVIFPEGTRSPDGYLHAPFPGIGLLVHKAKVPVIPCYVEGSYEAFPRQVKYPKPAKVNLIYGQPLSFAHYYELPGCREIYEKIANEIIVEIDKLIPPGSPQKSIDEILPKAE